MTTIRDLKKFIAETIGMEKTDQELNFLVFYCQGFSLGLYKKPIISAQVKLSGNEVIFGEEYYTGTMDFNSSDMFFINHMLNRYAEWEIADYVRELTRWGMKQDVFLTHQEIRLLFYRGLLTPDDDEEEERMLAAAAVPVPIDAIREVVNNGRKS